MSRYSTDYHKNKSVLHLWSGEPKKITPTTDACLELSLVFGFDHAIGLFAQVFKKNAAGEDESVVEMDSKFDGLSKSHLIELIEYYATKEEREKKFKEILMKIAMDLPF